MSSCSFCLIREGVELPKRHVRGLCAVLTSVDSSIQSAKTRAAIELILNEYFDTESWCLSNDINALITSFIQKRERGWRLFSENPRAELICFKYARVVSIFAANLQREKENVNTRKPGDEESQRSLGYKAGEVSSVSKLIFNRIRKRSGKKTDTRAYQCVVSERLCLGGSSASCATQKVLCGAHYIPQFGKTLNFSFFSKSPTCLCKSCSGLQVQLSFLSFQKQQESKFTKKIATAKVHVLRFEKTTQQSNGLFEQTIFVVYHKLFLVKIGSHATTRTFV